MWAMQYLVCEKPRTFITSGGLGTMGYGLPAAVGAKAGRPEATVICVDGDGCFQMTCQELTTAALEGFPIVVVIINNGWLGMVRQWQELLHGGRYSESYTDSLPDFVKLAEAFGGHGIRCSDPADLDAAILEMIETPKPVIFDCVVDQKENCFPMIPSGKAHNDMIMADLGDDAGVDIGAVIDEKGKILV